MEKEQYLLTYSYVNPNEETDEEFLIFDFENNPIDPKINGWNKQFYKIQKIAYDDSNDLIKRLEKAIIQKQIEILEEKLAKL